MKIRRIATLGAVALLGACDVNIDNEETRAGERAESAALAEQPAAGKSEEGRFSIKGPGFDMKINIPEEMASRASADGDNDLLYPGAAISGMHVEALDGKASKTNSGVELRFTSSDAPEKVAAWYRDPARATGFAVGSAAREGGAILISGTEKSDGDPFSVRLSPATGGGTEGRLVLSDRR